MTKITQVCIAFIFVLSMNSFSSNTISANNNNGQITQPGTIQRVRLNIVTPQGYLRQLLLGFTSDNAASDGVDYGYDALNFDDFPDDCNWVINDDRFVIQGVGAFDETKKYPLGLFLTNSGSVDMSLNSLENFDSPIDVYIHDALLNTYTKINDESFTTNMTSGNHLDRFFIAFIDENALLENASLSTKDNELNTTVVNYLRNTKELYINTNSTQNIKNIRIYSILGKELFVKSNINTREIKIPMAYLNTNYGIVSVETDKGITSKKVILQ